MYVESGVIPLLAQVAMAGTVFFTSVSSTGILQLVSQPYVCSLYASPGPKGLLKATRLTLMGREYETFFNRNDVSAGMVMEKSVCISRLRYKSIFLCVLYLYILDAYILSVSLFCMFYR